MKKNLNRTLMLTAAVLMVGAAANAQNLLDAKVPFKFRMNGVMLPAGTYHVGHAAASGTGVINVRGSENSAFAIGTPRKNDDTRSRMVFLCGESSGCTLSEVWTSDGRGWVLPAPKLNPGEKERLAVIYAGRKNAD